MSERENLDVGKVVSLIMENPALIEQIANLAGEKNVTEAEENEPVQIQAPKEEKTVAASQENIMGEISPGRRNRTQLLGALKPYVSKERAKAIDSMISIADILDLMKTR